MILVAACGDVTGTSAPAAGTAAVISQVLDGDSVRVLLDGVDAEVRLMGINAPEQDECYTLRSQKALETLLSRGAVTVTTVATDQFGRQLGYVRAGDEDVNLTMVQQGAALALDNDHDRALRYLAAEEKAVAAGLGMWAPNACGPPTEGFTIAEVRANPPGRDEDSLDGEWVDIANSGPAAVNLTDWRLRDESSTNRYRFPTGFVIEAGAGVRVVVGCGTDDAATVYWCSPAPVWNNGGDTALLLDASGNIAARLRYDG